MIGNYIKAVATAVSRTTAKLMKTGQTTSYRTGDDGDIEAGRNTSFTVLAENNPFGNTNRFTDELGTQTYTKNIVIDWSTFDGSTVLGYRRTTSLANWNSAIDQSLAVSIVPYTSGWRLPNRNELVNIIRLSQTDGFNYPPFSITANGLWTSTTSPATTLSSYWINNFFNTIIEQAKTTTSNYIPCRNFTVTGTTLS